MVTVALCGLFGVQRHSHTDGRGSGMDAVAAPARPTMFCVLPCLPVGLGM
jgi:hypothetical protein